MKVAISSTQRVVRLYPTGDSPGTNSCKSLSRSQGRKSMKNPSDPIGNWTRNLPACITVSQPTATPRTPHINPALPTCVHSTSTHIHSTSSIQFAEARSVPQPVRCSPHQPNSIKTVRCSPYQCFPKRYIFNVIPRLVSQYQLSKNSPYLTSLCLFFIMTVLRINFSDTETC